MSAVKLSTFELTERDVRIPCSPPAVIEFRTMTLFSKALPEATVLVRVYSSSNTVKQKTGSPKKRLTSVLDRERVEPSLVRVALEETELTAEEAARFQESLDKQEAQPRFRFQLLPTR